MEWPMWNFGESVERYVHLHKVLGRALSSWKGQTVGEGVSLRREDTSDATDRDHVPASDSGNRRTTRVCAVYQYQERVTKLY